MAALGQREAAFQTQLLGRIQEKRHAPVDQRDFIQVDIDVVMQSKVEVRSQIERYQHEEARVEASIREFEQPFQQRNDSRAAITLARNAATANTTPRKQRVALTRTVQIAKLTSASLPSSESDSDSTYSTPSSNDIATF